MFSAAGDLQLLQRYNTRRTVSCSYCFPTPLREIQCDVSCENVVFNFLFIKTIIFSNKQQKQDGGKPNLNPLQTQILLSR